MANSKQREKSGITLPPRAGLNTLQIDKTDINFAQKQLNQGGSAPDELTPAMRNFVNQVPDQKKTGKNVRVNEKKSNEIYSSLPVAFEREDLKLVAFILSQIPKNFGRKRPDFNQGDYFRLALKNQIKKDLKIIKKGEKIFYSRSLLSVNWFKNLLPKNW